jgi:RIO-like serine/threonine protein kinase
MSRQLKQDLFGRVLLEDDATHGTIVVRELRDSRWWLRWLARHLARREVRALRRLDGLDRVPRVLAADRQRTQRSWIAGEPMQIARPVDPAYFREALRLLRQLHARGVVHNDLAKEPNWLVTPQGEPALIDFQLALCRDRSTRLFRSLAHDDLRHLLKHKRTYAAQRLTARQKRILATPSIVTRIWMATGKRLYRFITRRVLHWSDREGAGDRQL